MKTAEAFKKIQAVQMPRLRAAAMVAKVGVEPFVPIDKGIGLDSLRGSGEIIDDGKAVYLQYGARGASKEYAAYQYATAKQHIFRGGAMGRMVSILSGLFMRRATGKPESARYPIAYDQATSQGLLTKFPNGARWFKIILRSQDLQRKMTAAYVGKQ